MRAPRRRIRNANNGGAREARPCNDCVLTPRWRPALRLAEIARRHQKNFPCARVSDFPRERRRRLQHRRIERQRDTAGEQHDRAAVVARGGAIRVQRIVGARARRKDAQREHQRRTSRRTEAAEQIGNRRQARRKHATAGNGLIMPQASSSRPASGGAGSMPRLPRRGFPPRRSAMECVRRRGGSDPRPAEGPRPGRKFSSGFRQTRRRRQG